MKTFKVQSQKPNIRRSTECFSSSEPFKVLKQINQFWGCEHFPMYFIFFPCWRQVQRQWNIFLVITKTIHSSREIMVESINLVYEVVTVTVLQKRENELADKVFFTWNLLFISVWICYALRYHEKVNSSEFSLRITHNEGNRKSIFFIIFHKPDQIYIY